MKQTEIPAAILAKWQAEAEEEYPLPYPELVGSKINRGQEDCQAAYLTACRKRWEEGQELNLTVKEERKLFSNEVGFAILDGCGNLICEIWEPVVNTGWVIRFTFGGSLKNQPTSEQAINAAKEYLKKCFLPQPPNK